MSLNFNGFHLSSPSEFCINYNFQVNVNKMQMYNSEIYSDACQVVISVG